MLEYFIATPGARKGLVDTALRTADSGYLTRRLVDVAQELIIRRGPDCRRDGDVPSAASGSRTSAPTSRRRSAPTSRPGCSAGRSPTTSRCRTAPCSPPAPRSATRTSSCCATTRASPASACARRSRARPSSACRGKCYGRSLATGKTIELGEAVGVIAAQSIGEPGTQLTMRTFHTGGIAGSRHRRRSAPRRRAVRGPQPKGKATLARTSGVVRIAEDEGKGRVDHDRRPTTAPRRPTRCRASPRLEVADGQEIAAGDAIVERPPRPEGAARDQGRPRDAAVPRRARCRRCTATRACRSTTSTSSSSCGR